MKQELIVLILIHYTILMNFTALLLRSGITSMKVLKPVKLFQVCLAASAKMKRQLTELILLNYIVTLLMLRELFVQNGPVTRM